MTISIFDMRCFVSIFGSR